MCIPMVWSGIAVSAVLLGLMIAFAVWLPSRAERGERRAVLPNRGECMVGITVAAADAWLFAFA